MQSWGSRPLDYIYRKLRYRIPNSECSHNTGECAEMAACRDDPHEDGHCFGASKERHGVTNSNSGAAFALPLLRHIRHLSPSLPGSCKEPSTRSIDRIIITSNEPTPSWRLHPLKASEFRRSCSLGLFMKLMLRYLASRCVVGRRRISKRTRRDRGHIQ